MDTPELHFQHPVIPYLEAGNYREWSWAVKYHLDWFGLRQFIDGTASEPDDDASEYDKIAYKKQKMMAYSLIRDSIDPWARQLLREVGLEPRLYDPAYDAELLWDAVHVAVPLSAR